MKKLFSLLTVLFCAVVLSTTAFAADDAYSVYQKYLNKSKSIKSMELAITQKGTMTVDGYSVELSKQSGSAKMLMTSDNKLQMETKITDSETKETVYGYFKDNYLYTKAGNEKIKIKYAANDALSESANVDNTLTKDDLKNATVEKVDGGVKLTYKIKGSDVRSAMPSLADTLNLPDDVAVSFTNATISMVFGDDGSLKTTSNSYGIKLSDGSTSINLKITQKTTVKSVNSVTKISFPSDLNTYKTVKAA